MRNSLPKSVNKHSRALTKKTHVHDRIFHGKATLTDEGLSFIDEISRNIDWEGEAGQSQEGCEISGVKACQDGDE